MSRLIEGVVKFFGEKTPVHKLKGSVDDRGNIRIKVEIEQPKNPVTVTFEPGTQIRIDGEDGYRPIREGEVIFAREVYFYGHGMSTGKTTEGKWFKALNEPKEINPLEIAKT